VIELSAGHHFAGAGGMTIGFEMAGIRTAWETDILYGQDIKTLKAKDCTEVDVIVGGPPCLRTSAAAALSGKKTDQSIWCEMLRFIIEAQRDWKKPPAWIVVEQPASVDKSIIADWTQDLYRIGYGCAGRIINSKHWVPQQRARWVIVARLGENGLVLRDYLYSDRIGGGRRFAQNWKSKLYNGLCPACVPGGIFSRLSKRKVALMGAGNALPVPHAAYIAERIVAVDDFLRKQKP